MIRRGLGNVVVSLNVTGSKTVIAIAIAIARGRGIEIVIMKLLMLTMVGVVPMIETITMIRLNISMNETDRVIGRENMTMWMKRVIMDGMNNLNMDICVQRASTGTMTTLNIT